MDETQSIIGLFTFFLLLNTMVAIAVIILHELGHATLGIAAGCKDIVTLIKYPAFDVLTELTCERGIEIIPFGALLFTIPFSLSFLLLRSPERKLLWIALGLTLFTAAQDMFVATNMGLSFPVFLTIGFSLILYGEDEFIKNIVSRE